MDRDGFRDRSDRFSYLVARENARRIAADPRLLDDARSHLARFLAPDPYQRDGVALWLTILDAGPGEVVRRLLDRSAAGDYARQTAPSFGALPAAVRARLAQAAARPIEEDAA